MRLPHRFLLLLLSALVPVGGAAAQGWYHVEVIVFDQRGASGSAEAADHIEVPDLAGVQEIGAGGPFASLADSQRQLGGVIDALQSSGERRVLLHRAWRQPIGDRRDARPVRLHGGAPLTVRRTPQVALSAGAAREPGDGTRALPSPEQAVPSAFADLAGAHSGPITVQALDGTLLISRSRFLHVWADLLYTVPLSTPRADSTAVQFRMRDHRRMRSGELHYLDHPAFGLILRVSPTEAPPP